MSTGAGVPVRVFLSYAHEPDDDGVHERRVRDFWIFLRTQGLDARLDLPAADQPQDWSMWMLGEVKAADFVLVVASPAYRRRAEGEEPAGQGRGVRWEAALIREAVYADPEAARLRFLPVVLPGCSRDDIPVWMGRETGTHYLVTEYTPAGAQALLRYLTGRSRVEELPPIATAPGIGTAPGSAASGLRTEVVLRAEITGEGLLTATTQVAGRPIGSREGPVPGALAGVTTARLCVWLSAFLFILVSSFVVGCGGESS